MGEETISERAALRIPVEAPWLLGDGAQCVIGGAIIALCTPIAEVRLTKGDFVRRTGRMLQFCSQTRPIGHPCIEFAGLGRDAWYEVTCPDEAIAAFAAARIEAMAGRTIPAEMRDLIYSLKPK